MGLDCQRVANVVDDGLVSIIKSWYWLLTKAFDRHGQPKASEVWEHGFIGDRQ